MAAPPKPLATTAAAKTERRPTGSPANPYDGPEWWKKMRPAQKYECLKCLFYVVNTILCGLALVNVTVSALMVGKYYATKTDSTETDNALVKKYQTAGTVGLVMGSITMLQSLLGCFGIACSNRCMLMMYLIISSVLVMMDLSNVVYCSYEVHTLGNLDGQLIENLKKYDGKKNEETYYMDYNQVTLRCCGVNSFNDYENTPWFKTKTAGQLVPYSCCQLKEEKRRNDYSFDTWELQKDDLMDETCPSNPSGKANTIQPCVTLIQKKERVDYVAKIIISIFSALLLIGMMTIARKVRGTFMPE